VDHPSPSNNVAEYTACIKALERLIELGLTEDVLVRSDSQLLIYQLKGFYAVKAPRITPLYEKVTALIGQFKRIRFEWVPREENEEADELSRRAYYDYVSKNLTAFLEKYKKYLATEKQRALLARPRDLMPSLAFQEGGLEADLQSPVEEALIGVASPSF
jgi:hypothetical protein